MSIEYRYTRHQVARAARADHETEAAIYLLKNVSSLHLTYQISLLAYRALQEGRKLVLRIPKRCKVQPRLQEFQRRLSTTVRIERV